MNKLREEAPTEFAGVKVIQTEDFQTQKKTRLVDGNVEEIPMTKSNVLKYYLADESWIAVRPSGTEPKIKFYVGVKGNDHADAEQKITALATSLAALTAE